MDLFIITNGIVYPSPHALMIKPYKDIWEKDTSEGKENSLRWFRFIELLCSPKKSNPYYGYTDKEQRSRKVKQEVFGDELHEIDADLMFAVMAYEEHLRISSPSYDTLVDAEAAALKLRRFLKDFEPNSRTPSGALVLKPKDITAALQELPKVNKALADARDKVNEELKEDVKTRNNREIGLFER